MEQFSVGTVVKLKSGSPLMTVAYQTDRALGIIGAVWIDKDGKPQFLEAKPDVFVVVDTKAGG